MSQSLDQLLMPFGISAPALIVADLQLDSRLVRHGDLFVAVGGHQVDGRHYINDAVTQGAAAVIVDTDGGFTPPDVSVPCVGVPQLAARLSALAGRFYGEPAQQLDLVGITGTNGKTTTALIIAQWRTLLASNTSVGDGFAGKAGVMGTVGNGLFGELEPATNTTGSAVAVQANLARLRQQGADLVAMEVSSHGLVQQRVAGLCFAATVFTNLSRDHLDYHGTMAAYGAAKAELLKLVDPTCAVINADDPLGQSWLAAYPLAVAFSIDRLLVAHQGRQITALGPDFHQHGFRTQINSSWGNGVLSAPLLGRFNVSNVLAALGALLVLGYPFAELLAIAPQLRPVTGRMECFGGNGAPLVVVDYAHTPDALAQALQALLGHCAGQLWCVVGCGGDRDRGKRSLMAGIAQQYADHVILTDDNPRTESPVQIMAEMVAGLAEPDRVQIEHDRASAIALALGRALPHDIILVAGKGHEDYQIIGTDKRHYSDRDTVAAALHTLLESCR